MITCHQHIVVPDLSTTEHIERTLTSKLQEVKGSVTEQWKQLQVNSWHCNLHSMLMVCGRV